MLSFPTISGFPRGPFFTLLDTSSICCGTLKIIFWHIECKFSGILILCCAGRIFIIWAVFPLFPNYFVPLFRGCSAVVPELYTGRSTLSYYYYYYFKIIMIIIRGVAEQPEQINALYPRVRERCTRACTRIHTCMCESISVKSVPLFRRPLFSLAFKGLQLYCPEQRRNNGTKRF